MRITGPGDASNSTWQFKELIGLVSQPYSAIKYERPGMTAHLKQSPPGVYDFQVIQGDGDLVMFSAQTDQSGNPIKPVHFAKGDMVITPAGQTGHRIFIERIVRPLYQLLFNARAEKF